MHQDQAYMAAMQSYKPVRILMLSEGTSCQSGSQNLVCLLAVTQGAALRLGRMVKLSPQIAEHVLRAFHLLTLHCSMPAHLA